MRYAGWPGGLVGGIMATVLCLAAAAIAAVAAEALSNPYLGDQDAVTEGRRVYRTRCIICHRTAGGRGPNLFASELSDKQFLETVINGRAGTQMPAFGLRMLPDDVWMVHAFIKSTDRY